MFYRTKNGGRSMEEFKPPCTSTPGLAAELEAGKSCDDDAALLSPCAGSSAIAINIIDKEKNSKEKRTRPVVTFASKVLAVVLYLAYIPFKLCVHGWAVCACISRFFRLPCCCRKDINPDVDGVSKPFPPRGRGQMNWTYGFILFTCFALGFFGLMAGYQILYLTPRDPCSVVNQVQDKVARDLFRFKNKSADFVALNRSIDEEASGILPKIIHQQWKSSSVPETYAAWHAQWRKFFPEPEYTHVLWTDESAHDLIAKHYSWFLDIYEGYEFNIQRADAARYFILHHSGGLYADLDYEPIQNFWHLLPKTMVGLIESPYQYNEFVQNSLMTSPRKDPLWLDMFIMLKESAAKPVLQSTGPVFLDVALKTTKREWSLLPCEIFHRIPLNEHAKSPFLTLLHREILGRVYPMRSCGNYADDRCQYGKHHNTASYLKDVGILKLLWT